jgi:putative transposase
LIRWKTGCGSGFALHREILEEELRAVLGRGRYERCGEGATGHRNGHRARQVIGTFGAETVKVPRARLVDEAGRTTEWRSQALRRYQRLTKKAEALIAAVYLAGTNTRRVKRALFGLFGGAVSKDVVSRAWRKVRTDWEAWCARSLTGEDIVRLILDGSVVKARIDRKATAISVLAAIGVRRDGQKVLLAIRNMGGESTAAWRAFLDDLDARGLQAPAFVIVDGAPASRRRWPGCGRMRRFSGARFTSTATSSPTRRSRCTTSSPRTTATWSMPRRRRRSSSAAGRSSASGG